MTNEALTRLIIFILSLATLCLLEVTYPRRELRFNRKVRWPANFSIMLLDTLLLRLLFPMSAVAFAQHLESIQFGLLSIIKLSETLKIILAVIYLDLCIYWQHVVFHKIPFLWRFHRMHHTDLDFDVTTASRFHPIEMLLSLIIKFVVIALIGAPAFAVFCFEVILNTSSMFNHSNIAIPTSIDRFLRRFIVTPDMHRIHHSIYSSETNSNYGFFLSWWDYIFHSYKQSPKDNHLKMRIGLKKYQDSKFLTLSSMIKLPFMKIKSEDTFQ
ncbi:MAG: sterol desaturase [Bdellovibrionales bacterium CG12_big_fil_rev_8_21_14_0_65_38_15]|nr:MAG: sterol desaturase [Bdellovibrionales bacterium CG22_combo_CG10-13_8_21_14_all_38_13]PIQ56743.1 MAG: sterol desaturase [Bdellovibrionales bacterium CG12_big_fil_rev_8_21_14_0_65_38_15]PIR31029.1 MAG: sterol desaturase [Bdellovibrionales bacterium CG11_big_fil_rev_8_21_14_0_20_38_13]